MMKVLYDISFLSYVFRSLVPKAGIFRVAENLIFGLNAVEECELFCHTSGLYSNVFHGFDYLKSNIELSEIPLLGSTDKTWKLRQILYQTLSDVNSRITHATGIQRMILRLKRKPLFLFNQCLASASTLSPNLLKELDIYHSPFDPIPPEIQEVEHIQKFLTVHDLIPVFHPELFPQENIADNITIQALSSIGADSWFFCVSQATKNDLCNYSSFIDPQRVFVTHLAASDFFHPFSTNEDFERVRKQYGIPDSPYILSLSTLEPRKNIEHIIRCFFQLIEQEKIQDLNLVLVGAKGWKYETIFTEISSNPQLNERVIVTGYVADTDLAAIYSNALAFVYLSLYEGFGLPPLEAMQCGTPVIASKTSSLPEVVGDAGILLDPRDADGLCNSLLKMYYSPMLRKSMSNKSLEQAKKFSWEQTIQKTIAGYKVALRS